MKILSLVKKRIFPVLFLGIVLSGCGVWTDFTTYFNLYYNTKVAFEKAEAEIAKQQKDVFEFKEEKIVGTADQNLTKVVEKCSKILQFNSESSYVDDALFMIGKTFYYQQSYTRAIRKFLELLTVEEKSLALEAELWLGKSRLQMRDFEEGLSVLENVKEKALAEDETEYYDDACIAEIAYYLYKEDYSKTIENCKALIATTDNDELISKTYYKLGEIYILLEDYDNALQSFAEVNEYSPDFDMEFYSQLEYAKVQAIQKDYQGSMDLLDDLLNEDKFSDHLDLINIEIGKNHYANNEIQEAMDVFIYVDSTFSKSDNVGLADFYLGKIWEFNLVDYDSAKQYYKKVSTSKIAEEYKDTAKAKMEIFDRFAFLKKEYNVNSDRLFYLENPEKFIEDSVAYAEYEVRLNDFLEEKLQEEQSQTATTNPQDLLSQRQTPNTTNQTADDAPGQRQNTAVDQPTNNTKADPALAALKARLKPSDYPPELIAVKKPEKTSFSPDSLNSLLAKNMLELGNLFFADLDVADSAYFYYDELLTQYKDHRLYPNALFAMGTLLSTENQNEKADSLFRIIYNDYPKSTVYIEAAKKLNLWVEEDHYDPSKEIYIEAEDKYYNSQVDSAIAIWQKIVKDHPSSEYAPKALLSIGYILENDLDLPDSAYNVYSKLSELYSTSKYAAQVSGKLMAYNDHLKMVEDSLRILNGTMEEDVPADSLGNGNDNNMNIIGNQGNEMQMGDSSAVSNAVLNEDSLTAPRGKFLEESDRRNSDIHSRDSSLSKRRIIPREIRNNIRPGGLSNESENAADSTEARGKNDLSENEDLNTEKLPKDSLSVKRKIIPREIRNNIRPGGISDDIKNSADSLKLPERKNFEEEIKPKVQPKDSLSAEHKVVPREIRNNILPDSIRIKREDQPDSLTSKSKVIIDE